MQYKNIHFIGIGGCSMSGLALMFSDCGCRVHGSDNKESPFTRALVERGISVTIGHAPENVGESDLVVYSAAIPETNCERVYAKEKGIPQMERRDALGELSRTYNKVVCVSGCHGKTTITSMLALINERANMGATVHVGGFVDFLGGGVKIGGKDMFITEACEYVESFLSLKPTVIIMNNIDNDHLNYYHDIEHITDAFKRFVGLLPKDGLLIACVDDVRVKAIFDEYAGDKISYGLTDSAEYFPGNISYDNNGCAEFSLMQGKNNLGRVKLNVIGDFNMLNAIAASAAALRLGVGLDTIASALDEFRSTRRRFEYYGTCNGAKVFHDYAHHPGEIKAVLGGASKYPHKKMYVVFQCNSYSRAKTLFIENVRCFSEADEVLVPDIYPGRETDDGSVHARDMVNAITKSGVCSTYIPDFDGIAAYLKKNADKDDIIITLGSGDVYEQTKKLLD